MKTARKSIGSKLSKIIAVRVDPEEHATLVELGKAANLSISELFRDYIVKNKFHIYARHAPSRESRQSVILLQKISDGLSRLLFITNKDISNGLLSADYYKEIVSQLVQLNNMAVALATDISNDR